MVLIWETREEWKTELTLEPPNDFESGTGGLLIQTTTIVNPLHDPIRLWMKKELSYLKKNVDETFEWFSDNF